MGRGVVNMRDREMRLMARSPAAESELGKAVPNHPVMPYLRQGMDHAVFQLHSNLPTSGRVREEKALPQFLAGPRRVMLGAADTADEAPGDLTCVGRRPPLPWTSSRTIPCGRTLYRSRS